MNTCGVLIGPDVENIIQDYVFQIEHQEKYWKCLSNIKNFNWRESYYQRWVAGWEEYTKRQAKGWYNKII